MSATAAKDGGAAERRLHPRRNVIQSQLVTVDLATGEGAQRRGIVIDISEGGMAVQPFLPLTPGATSSLQFDLPGTAQTVRGTGMVAWTSSGGRAGIRFINVPHESRERLRQWLGSDPNRKVEASVAVAPQTTPRPDSHKKESEELDLNAVLQLIAERARNIAAASGVAVALGNSTGMTCRVSFGNAPDVGVRLQPNSGLSGHCVATGEMVHCADTQADSRVNAEAARSLNLRSVLILPVRANGRLSGLLEVMSAQPNAFEPRHIARLQRIAELLGSAVEEPGGKPATAELAEPLADASLPTAAPEAAPQTATIPAPPPVETSDTIAAGVWIPPSVSASPATTAPAKALDHAPSYTVFPEPAPPEPVPASAPPVASKAAFDDTVIEPPAFLLPEIPQAAAPEPAVPFAEFEMESTKRGFPAAAKVGSLAVLLILALVATWYMVRMRRAAQPAAAPAPVTTTAPSVQPPATTPVPAPSNASPRISPPAAAPPAVKPPTASTAKPQARSTAVKPANTLPTDRVTMWPDNTKHVEEAVPAPALPANVQANTPGITALLGDVRVAEPKLKAEPARTSQLKPGKLIHRVEPVYPPTARNNGLGGEVVVSATITKKGTVANVRLVSGPPVLGNAAINAVKQWRYQPYVLDGRPVDVDTTVVVQFKPAK